MSDNRMPRYFPDVDRELFNLSAYNSRRAHVQRQAQLITQSQRATINSIARLAPWVKPGVALSFGRGFGLGDDYQDRIRAVADTVNAMSYREPRGPDPVTGEELPPYPSLFEEAALDHARNNAQLGRVIRPDQLLPGNRQNRLNTALAKANSLGLINDDGELVEPRLARDRPGGMTLERTVFNELRDAFRTSNRPMPYVDASGQRQVAPTFDMVAGPGAAPSDAMRAFRQYEARTSEMSTLRAEGFKTLPDAAEGNDRLEELAVRARVLGLLDQQGYLTPAGKIGGTPKGELMGQLRDAFREARVDLPILTDSRGPVVVRYSWDDPYEEPIFPNRIPESPDRGGFLKDIETAAGAGPLADQTRRISQTGLMVLNAPYQELQGLFRNVYDASKRGLGTGIASADIGTGLALHPSSQSDLGIALPQAIRGEPVDIGHGLFVDPDSAVARERVRREAERGQIAGQNITIGRAYASEIVEPGTKPYSVLSGLVDASVAIYADPAGLALGGLGKLNAARKVFAADDAVEAAGGLRGLRRMVSGPTADAWLNGTDGSRVVQAITDEASPTAIWRATNGKLPMSTVVELADATTPEDVRRIIRPALGTNIRTTDEVWKNPTILGIPRPSRSVSRLLATVPGDHIDTFDLNQAMTMVERWGRNAKMDDGVLTGFLDRLARTGTNRGQVLDVVGDVMKDTNGILEQAGVTSPVIRSQLTRLFRDTHEASRHWFVDEIGDDVPVWGQVLKNGELEDTLSPHLLSEFLNRYIPLPDYRAIRRLTSNKPWRFLTTKHTGWNPNQLAGEMRTIPATAMWLSEQVWKPLTLLRPAWTLRVVGEEQLRMAAAGNESMFHHPASYLPLKKSC